MQLCIFITVFIWLKFGRIEYLDTRGVQRNNRLCFIIKTQMKWRQNLCIRAVAVFFKVTYRCTQLTSNLRVGQMEPNNSPRNWVCFTCWIVHSCCTNFGQVKVNSNAEWFHSTCKNQGNLIIYKCMKNNEAILTTNGCTHICSCTIGSQVTSTKSWVWT